VVDFTWQAAGPIATRYLAAFGAQVIKVESRQHPDGLRTTPMPRPEGNWSVNVSGIFNNLNANKLSLAVNLNTGEGQDLIRRLVAIADVVIDNFGVDPFPRWGLTYPEVAAIRPDIIMLRSSVNGRTGSGKDYIGFGFTIGPASGINALMGFPEDPPVGTSTAHPDYSSNPHHAAIAILAALHYRHRTGRGQYIDLAQMESTVAFLGPAMTDYTVNRQVRERAGNRSPWAAPHGAYRCLGDDRWIAIAVTTDEEWRGFCRVAGQSWTGDARFATATGRLAAVDELDRLVGAWTRDRVAEELMDALQAEGVPAGVVQNHDDLLHHDPHLRDRGYFVALDHPEAGRRIHDGVAARLSATPGSIRTPAPLLGEHNDFILGDLLGLSEDAINQLYLDGAIE
jgi:benzylsuccinate CoA-transferase BbsF subunit